MNKEQEFVFNFQVFFAFLKKYKWRLALFAFLSLAVLGLVGVLLYFRLPGRSYIAQEVKILLPKQGKDDELVYPNGKRFSRLDIISPPVLEEVYINDKLRDIISFDDFQKKLSVINFSYRRTLLDAELASKLEKRNLNIADIGRIEDEYRVALAALDRSTYRIILDNSNIPPNLSAKILNDVMLNWFRIYSALESDKLPSINIASELEKVATEDITQSRMIALDRLRYHLVQLDGMIGRLYVLQNKRRVTLPSGEFLEDITSALEYITTYQFALLRQMISMNPSLRSELDQVYLQSRLSAEQLKLESLKSQRKMLFDSLTLGDNKNNVELSKSGQMESTLVVDSGFLAQLSAIFARDASNNLRKQLAEQNMVLANSIAKQETVVAFYQGILNKLNEVPTAVSGAGQVQFDQLLRESVKNVVDLSKKLNEFKELLVNDYYSSLNFYAPVGDSILINDPLIPPRKLAMGLLVVWLLLNAIYGGFLFAGKYVWKKTDKS